MHTSIPPLLRNIYDLILIMTVKYTSDLPALTIYFEVCCVKSFRTLQNQIWMSISYQYTIPHHQTIISFDSISKKTFKTCNGLLKYTCTKNNHKCILKVAIGKKYVEKKVIPKQVCLSSDKTYPFQHPQL